MSRPSRARLIGPAIALCALLVLPSTLAAQQHVTFEVGPRVPDWVRVMFSQAVATALPIMDAHLGLGLRDTRVRYVLAADRTTLLEWYQSHLGYTREFAETLLWAVGRVIRGRTGNYIVTRADGFGRLGPDRVGALRHVAHEMTHIVQGSVKRCPAFVPAWIMEGWADWAGLRVVDLAGERTYERQRDERIEVIRRYWGRTFFPTLVQLDRSEWARLTQSRGGPATYGSSWLAVERLIGSAGGPQALDAYCTVARTEGRWASFEQVFGTGEPDYALGFLRFMRELFGP